MPAEIFHEVLTETEVAVRDTLRRFAVEVMRPVGKQLDLLSAEDVIAKNSMLWEVHRKYVEIGGGSFANDESLTPVEAARIRALSSEMLGWGDAGLAISLGVSGKPTALAALSGNPELIEKYTLDKIGCWPITEPNHGSDCIYFGSDGAHGGSANMGDCVAKREGDRIVISGQKSSWVSNGSIAQVAALFTQYESDGVKGGGIFIVPLDSAGVTRGKPTDKIGQRALNQGEIFFDNVSIPLNHMIAGHDDYHEILESTLVQANGHMGSVFAGLARAALEHAVDYAKGRIQGGKPIFEHQAVRSRLFEMYRKVEAARALNLSVVCRNAVTPRPETAVTSKVTSTRTAMDVSTEALCIYGGAGMIREHPIEKMMRDASVSMIEDGENSVLGLIAASRL